MTDSTADFFLTLSPTVVLSLVRIPSGEFLMGSDLWKYDQQPQHRVSLSEFWIGKVPVTVGQYAEFIKRSGYPARPGQIEDSTLRANLPVVLVTWYDAQAFCHWIEAEFLSKEGLFEGMQARLPSEAEWEKAARGPDGREYPWGNENPDSSRCNYYDGNIRVMVPVGNFSPLGDSPYGCADMAGNVFQWTHSLYKPYPYLANDGREGEEAVGERVVRGGSASSMVGFLRCSCRVANDPGKVYTTRGFRVCVSPDYY